MTMYEIVKINGRYVVKGSNGQIIETSQDDPEVRRQTLELAELGRFNY